MSEARDFEAHRGELTRLAYRMTGDLAQSEDLVQEAWLRFSGSDVEVTHPRAYLYRVVTRLCLDHLKSARVRRETYPGPWLPEPVVEPASTPAEIANELSMALLVSLERLSALERAAFLLREVYDFSYSEMGELLSRSGAACRQLTTRARTHVRLGAPRFAPEPEVAQQVIAELIGAMARGDVDGFAQRLCDDAVMISDGGGKANAALKPVIGANRVARLWIGLARKFPLPSTAIVTPARINGLPGLVITDGGVCLQTLAFEFDDERVSAIYTVRNPDKLGRVTV